MAASIFFTCNFCTYRSKIQHFVNTHMLFEHGFLNPDCSTDTESFVENYLYSADKFKRCIICNTYTHSYVHSKWFKNSILDLKDIRHYVCDNHHFGYKFYNEEKEQGNKVSSNTKLQYLKIKKYQDAIIRYLNNLPKFKIANYKKTLKRIIQPDWSINE